MRTHTLFGRVALAVTITVAVTITGDRALAQAGSNPVPQLVERLDSKQLWHTIASVRSLEIIFAAGKPRTPDFPAVAKAITAKIQTGQWWELRRECVGAAGAMLIHDAADELKVALDDKVFKVGITAARSLGILARDKNDDALTALQGAMDGKILDIILVVDEELTKSMRAKSVRPLFVAVLRDENSSLEAKVAAMKFLAPMVGAEDKDLMLEYIDDKQHWRLHTEAIIGLKNAVNRGAEIDQETIDMIGDTLGHGTANIADAALDFLVGVNNRAATKVIIKQAEKVGTGGKSDTTWRNRSYALRALFIIAKQSRSRVKSALPAVIRNLGDKTENVRNAAKNVLFQVRQDTTLPSTYLFPMLLAELEEAKPLRLRSGIIDEMGTSCKWTEPPADAEKARGFVPQPFQVEEWNIPKRYYDRTSAIAAQSLVDSVADDTAWTLRRRAIKLLRLCGDTSAIVTIADVMNDSVPNVRQEAAVAVMELAKQCTVEQKAAVAEVLASHMGGHQRVWQKHKICAAALKEYPHAVAVKPLFDSLIHRVLNVQEAAVSTLISYTDKDNPDLRKKVEDELYKVLDNRRYWEYGSRILGALTDPRAASWSITIINKGNWRSQVGALNAVEDIMTAECFQDKALKEAVVKATESRVTQVFQAANRVLAIMVKCQGDNRGGTTAPKSKEKSQLSQKPKEN